MLARLTAALLGFAFAFGLMPRVMRFARDNGILDHPNEDRRVHLTAVPRLGGVAIFGATVLAAAIVFGWHYFDSSFPLPKHIGTMPGMIIGATIIFVVGVVDDLRGVRPAFKLVAQTAAALAMVAYGFRIESVTITGGSALHLGFFAIPLTVFWVVGMTNAFNLIDGVDGLAGTMGIIGLTACIGVEVLLHDSSSLIVTFALMGAVLAFLRFNLHPAKIFLGDSGSMLLGFFLSVRAVTSATGDDGVTYALVPLFALAYPLVDTFVAITRRWLRGHPLSRADGRHIHHQILGLGLSPTRTVELIGLFFSSVALMGISIVFAPPQVTVAFGVGGAVLFFAAFFYGVKWLGYSEFTEVGASVRSVFLNARSHVRNKVVAGEIADRLLRADSIDEIGAMLADCAAEFRLLEVSIVPGVPPFRGPASRHISPVGERPFRVDYPIAWEHEGHLREVVLRLWCERPGERHHTGAERIATRLGAALELWLQRNPGALGGVAVPEETAPRVFLRGAARTE